MCQKDVSRYAVLTFSYEMTTYCVAVNTAGVPNWPD